MLMVLSLSATVPVPIVLVVRSGLPGKRGYTITMVFSCDKHVINSYIYIYTYTYIHAINDNRHHLLPMVFLRWQLATQSGAVEAVGRLKVSCSLIFI